jgi:hypothetical protein
MKLLSELTAADLRQHKVWQYHGVSDLKAQITASSRTSLREEESSVFLAATDFQLHDGTRHVGYCSPTDPSGLDYLQPFILVGMEHVALWHEEQPAETAAQMIAVRLGRNLDQVFPILWRCIVPVEGQLVSGQVLAQDVGAV